MKDLIDDTVSASPWPARLDLAQSVTGLILAVFMWVHLFLVSSILLGKKAMFYVAGFFELKFLSNWEHGYPAIVSAIGIIIFAIFILHAGIAVRKFPASWRQHRVMRHQMKMMKHSDTNLWYWQAVTGFIMFFLGSVHLYIMISQPDTIGPHGSADRFVAGNFWPLYLILLISVELHATIGMYRLAVKWLSLKGTSPKATRKKLKRLKTVLTVFFLTIGLATFGTYVRIGLEDRPVGERYHPSQHSTSAEASQGGEGE